MKGLFCEKERILKKRPNASGSSVNKENNFKETGNWFLNGEPAKPGEKPAVEEPNDWFLNGEPAKPGEKPAVEEPKNR